MPDPQTIAVAIYVAGVMVGLATVDARPAARVGLALCWPLGPAAFVVTIAILFLVALIAFPVFGAAVVLAAGALAWWTMS